jgi:hypothetical protein
MEPRFVSRWPLVLCAALVGAFLAQGGAALRANSQAYDEGGHIAAGYSFLARHDYRLYREHPPLVRELCALPVYLIDRLPFAPDPKLWDEAEMWTVGQHFVFGNPPDPARAERIVTLSRIPNLTLGALLVVLIGWWAYRLWGPWSAVLATALAAFDPNLVAHSSIVGTDIGVSLFLLLAVYLLWEYGNSRRAALLIGVGLATGAALTAKFSALLLLPVFACLLAAHVAFGRSLLWADGVEAAAPRGRRLTQAVVMAVVIGVTAAIPFAVAYSSFRGLADWLFGVSWQITKLGVGHPAYLGGEYSRHGWWSYYPTAFLIKTPLATLLLIFAGLLLVRLGRPLTARDALFLLLPVAGFWFAVERSHVDVGVRYLLPTYPFLFVLTGRLATWQPVRPALVPAVACGLIALNAVSVLRWAPYPLTYFNELVRGPVGGHEVLVDSNIDWGEGLKALKAYTDREALPMIYFAHFGSAPPEGYGIACQDVPAGNPVLWPRRPMHYVPPGGRRVLAVSLTALHGVYAADKGCFAWLRSRVPVANPGYSILVYDLTDDPEGQLELARVYVNAGWHDAAAHELTRLSQDQGETAAAARKLLDHLD